MRKQKVLSVNIIGCLNKRKMIMEIIKGIFWSIIGLVFLDIMFLDGLFTDALAKRIRGKDEEEK